MATTIDILAKLNLGLSDQEVAKLLDIDPERVAKSRLEAEAHGLIRKPAGGTKMSHEDREKRRKDIAAFVDAGNSREEAAKKFGVSVATVIGAVSEFGKTEPRERKEATHAEIFKIAALFVVGLRDADIAKEIDFDRERIRVMRGLAEKAGLFEGLGKVVDAAIEQGRRQG